MEENTPQKKYTPSQAFVKICKWCAYQERCQQEARTKLYEYGLFKDDVENIIVQLIDQNFINEERFAIAFAGGKFRQLGWGKEKIKHTLKYRAISDYCIRKALSQISDEDYFRMLQKIIKKREKEEKTTNSVQRKFKIISYVLSKGYEKELIIEAMDSEK
jgi:regulatory protein